MIQQTYSIKGMTCNSCKAAVEKHISEIDGVSKATVRLEKEELSISMHKPIAFEVLKNALPNKYSLSEEKTTVAEALPTQSKFQQLKPLFLIFFYISTVSVLLHHKSWSWNAFMLDFMGLFYIVFSFFKMLDLKGFSESFRMYDPLAKKVGVYALFYPFLETLLGIFFLMRFQIEIALVATLLLLGITTIGVSQVLLSKSKIRCACLGTALKLPMTEATLIENAVMMAMAVVMLTN